MIKIMKVTHLGNDTVEVRGFDDLDPDKKEIVAHGWMSATTNHFDPQHYGEDGHLLPNAKSRPMTNEEKMTYWITLLAQTQQSKQILFEVEETPTKE